MLIFNWFSLTLHTSHAELRWYSDDSSLTYPFRLPMSSLKSLAHQKNPNLDTPTMTIVLLCLAFAMPQPEYLVNSVAYAVGRSEMWMSVSLRVGLSLRFEIIYSSLWVRLTSLYVSSSFADCSWLEFIGVGMTTRRLGFRPPGDCCLCPIWCDAKNMTKHVKLD